jgi:hypothetical protein
MLNVIVNSHGVECSILIGLYQYEALGRFYISSKAVISHYLANLPWVRLVAV